MAIKIQANILAMMHEINELGHEILHVDFATGQVTVRAGALKNKVAENAAKLRWPNITPDIYLAILDCINNNRRSCWEHGAPPAFIPSIKLLRELVPEMSLMDAKTAIVGILKLEDLAEVRPDLVDGLGIKPWLP